jgi:phosphoserine phosphatase RsbU/P
MGHGLVSSVLALSLRDSLPLIALSAKDKALAPAEVLRILCSCHGREQDDRASFFTIAYGLLDEASGDYSVVRAGHTPAMHLESGGKVRVHYTKGGAVGLTREAEVEEARGTLARGDRLLVLSDGLLETFGGEGPLDREVERIASFASKIRGARLEAFVDAFRRHSREVSSKGGAQDDVSLLVIERL